MNDYIFILHISGWVYSDLTTQIPPCSKKGGAGFFNLRFLLKNCGFWLFWYQNLKFSSYINTVNAFCTLNKIRFLRKIIKSIFDQFDQISFKFGQFILFNSPAAEKVEGKWCAISNGGGNRYTTIQIRESTWLTSGSEGQMI